jgi:predicted transposase YdaD
MMLLGNADDSPERAEAIHIIQKSRQNSRDYKTVSKVNQGALLALLQESHNVQETGIVGQLQIQLQDIQTTMEKVNMEVRHVQCMYHLP